MNLAYHDVRAPPKDYNRLIVIVVLLPSRIRMCVPVLLTFFRAPPKDYNRVIVIAHALAQLRTITFLEPSSEGVVCNEHGIVLAAFEKGERVHWLSRRAMSVTVGHLKVPDVTLCSTVCRGSM